jgi:hypothetical protein
MGKKYSQTYVKIYSFGLKADMRNLCEIREQIPKIFPSCFFIKLAMS